MHHAFTLESQGYDRYLYRRAVLPKLGWAAGAVAVIVAALILFS